MIFYWLFGAAGLAFLAISQKTAIVETWQETGDSWTRFDPLFASIGADYGVDPKWLKAFALNESSLGDDSSVARGLEVPTDIEGSKSSDGLSWGLMQVTVKTGRDYDPECSPEKLNDPKYSIDLAAQLIADLKKKFTPDDERRLEWIVKSYNQGAGNTKKERAGLLPNHPDGFAQAYWERWKRNFDRVNAKPGAL